MVPEGGGGGGVRADRTAAGPGAWEIFVASSLSGGPLVSGDRVAFVTADGTHYLQAAGGGGSALRATGQSVGSWETFAMLFASPHSSDVASPTPAVPFTLPRRLFFRATGGRFGQD